MTGPRVLDLFCGAGGFSSGFRAAGFNMTGVNLKSRRGRSVRTEPHRVRNHGGPGSGRGQTAVMM